MIQPIFRLFLFRGSPTEVNGNVATITTFALLLVAITWLMLPSSNSSDWDPDVLEDVRRVLLMIPLLQYAFVVLLIFTVLNIRKLNDRFAKTVAAYLGVQLVLQICDFGTNVISSFMSSNFRFILIGFQAALFVLLFGVSGYIFRHAFNIKLYQGVLAAIVMYLVAYFLAGVVTGLLLPNEVHTLSDILRADLTVPTSE